jgi:hypothetical protein
MNTALFALKIAEIAGLDKEIEKVFDKIVDASPVDFGIQDIVEPIIETVPIIANLTNITLDVDSVVEETFTLAQKADELVGIEPLDYDDLLKNIDKVTDIDNKLDNTLNFLDDVENKIDAEYKKFTDNELEYIEHITKKAVEQAMKAPFIIASISAIVAIAVLTKSSKYISRIISKVTAKVKTFAKKLATKIKTWIQNLKTKIKNLKPKVKNNKTRAKKAKDKALKRKRDTDNRINKKLQQIDTKDIKKSVDDIKNSVNDRILQFGMILKDKSFSFASYSSVLFLILDDTRNLILNTLGNFGKFVLDVAKGIVRLIPSLINVLKSTWKLIITGIDVTTILIFLTPALATFYLMTYYIQLLNGNY